MNKEKLRKIMNEMAQRVLNDTPIMPSQWVESALKINALRGELDNELIAYELLIGDKIAELINEGKTGTVAEKLAKTGETYKKFLELRAELKRIDEFIRLAKKRSMLEFS